MIFVEGKMFTLRSSLRLRKDWRGFFMWHQAKPQLQAIWEEAVPMLKEAALMVLAASYMMVEGAQARSVNKEGPEGPELAPWPPDRFLMVLLYALKHVHLLRYCANPACREPYFVARRGSQIYCSPPCAEPAQREAKLRWWREHGAKRRTKLRKKRGKHGKGT